VTEEIKETRDFVADLKALIAEQGYIYALDIILFEVFHHDLNKIH